MYGLRQSSRDPARPSRLRARPRRSARYARQSPALVAIKTGQPYESPNGPLINREFRLDPASKEAVEPGANLGPVMDMAVDVLVPLAGAAHVEARGVVAGPPV